VFSRNRFLKKEKSGNNFLTIHIHKNNVLKGMLSDFFYHYFCFSSFNPKVQKIKESLKTWKIAKQILQQWLIYSKWKTWALKILSTGGDQIRKEVGSPMKRSPFNHRCGRTQGRWVSQNLNNTIYFIYCHLKVKNLVALETLEIY
jgi:hypothetical protein